MFSAMSVTIGLTLSLLAQVKTDVSPVIPGAKPDTVEHIKIHGTALEGNLEGDAVDRDVIVFLPPGYATQKSRRYPVVYALHGYSIGADQWSREIHVPQTIEGAFAQGAQEMIVVLPDSKTVHNGSMYSSSVTTGDFEAFISHDVVAYIDQHYRTMANRASRGLAGHSMGGYGATRIGMKHPEVFGSVYIMSPCCLAPRGAGPANPASEKALEAVKTPADSAGLPFGLRTQLASAAAWSPNPKNPPLYLDLPTRTAWLSRMSSPNGRPTLLWLLPTSTSGICASIVQSPSTSATRMACAPARANCMTSWKPMASPTPLRFTAALIPAHSPTASIIM